MVSLLVFGFRFNSGVGFATDFAFCFGLVWFSEQRVRSEDKTQAACKGHRPATSLVKNTCTANCSLCPHGPLKNAGINPTANSAKVASLGAQVHTAGAHFRNRNQKPKPAAKPKPELKPKPKAEANSEVKTGAETETKISGSGTARALKLQELRGSEPQRPKASGAQSLARSFRASEAS